MMQKIMFQDNLYQLARSIDTVAEGLLLDISEDFFLDKTVDDVLFFDAMIKKISQALSANRQITGYMRILRDLHGCQQKYAALLDAIIAEKTAMSGNFESLRPKLRSIRQYHAELAQSIVEELGKSAVADDSRDIVSTNELSELLHF